MGVGASVDLTWTIRVVPGTPDLATVASLLRASYENATGGALPPEKATTSVRVEAPSFSPVLRVDRAAGERGDEVLAIFYYNNTGSGTALRAWSNWSLGGHFELVDLSPDVPTTPLADGFGVTWSAVSSGPYALTATLRVVRGLEDGLIMGLNVHWAATDGNGNPVPQSTKAASVELLAPSIDLAVSPVTQQTGTESTFVLTVTIANVGRAPATGWLNFTLPGGITFVDDNVSLPLDRQSKRFFWTIPSLGAGSSLVLGMTFQSGPESKTDAFEFALSFTDGRGSPAQAMSGGATVAIVGTMAPPLSDQLLLWVALGAAGAGGAAAFLWWRRASNVNVEDVFVAQRSGILLAHRSTGLLPYEDEDILVGMFKVVQDFIRDSFNKGTADEVQALDIGERKILIERGRHHFIAVVYSGQDRGTLVSRVRKVSQIIDDRFGDTIENWTGDMDDVRGIAMLLPLVWKSRRHGPGKHRFRRLPSGEAGSPQTLDTPEPALTAREKTGKGPATKRD